jgi:teichoic acid transport system permease protein
MKTLIEIIKDHITWRHQIIKLAKSDIIKTYKGAALGWAWAIIKPLVQIFCYWFAFGIGLKQNGNTYGSCPYVLWIIAGMVPWFYMSEMITQGASVMRTYSYLVTKMRYPISTIPTFVSLSKLVVQLLILVISLIIFAIAGFHSGIYLLQLPIYIILMVLFFMQWSLFSSLLAAISRDFLNLVEAFVQALFWLSGIVWDINAMISPTAHPLVAKILMFNPVTFIANGYRNAMVYKIWIWQQPFQFFAFCCVFVLMTVLAVWAYKKLRKEIPDVL